MTPASTRRKSLRISDWPKSTDVLLCSARKIDGSGDSCVPSARRSAGVGRPIEPAAVLALERAAAADHLEQLAADVRVDHGVHEHRGLAGAPRQAGHDAARGVGQEVLGALALHQRREDRVGLGLALGELDAHDQHAGRASTSARR